MLEIINEQNFNEKTAQGVIAIEFFTKTCSVCKVLEPQLQQVVDEGYSVYKVDAEESRELQSKYDVMRAPTLIILKDGNEVQRHTGFMPSGAILELLEGGA